MGLYTPTILDGNSYLSWFNDRGAIKDPAHTGTSKGLSQAINGGPIRKFLPKYANVYVTIQSHGLSTGARTHYVTANGARNRLGGWGPAVTVACANRNLSFISALDACALCTYHESNMAVNTSGLLKLVPAHLYILLETGPDGFRMEYSLSDQ